MSEKRQIEIFSAGCPVCQDTIDLVKRMACASCEISVLDMNDKEVAARAADLGIRSVPAVAINGKLADCCTGRGVDENVLRTAGIGVPLA
jgi:glutaredoxin 3